MMKYHIHEETFIHPATGLLTRRFSGQAVLTLDQRLGLAKINLNVMPAKATVEDKIRIINRAMADFNLPGTLVYKGRGQYIVKWIKHWNWKNVLNGERELYLNEDCGPDPVWKTMGLKEPSNNYEANAVPIILTREDWTEIYYSLEYKLEDPVLDKVIDHEWIDHLNRILLTIGPDGDIAAASGVEANG